MWPECPVPQRLSPRPPHRRTRGCAWAEPRPPGSPGRPAESPRSPPRPRRCCRAARPRPAKRYRPPHLWHPRPDRTAPPLSWHRPAPRLPRPRRVAQPPRRPAPPHRTHLLASPPLWRSRPVPMLPHRVLRHPRSRRVARPPRRCLAPPRQPHPTVLPHLSRHRAARFGPAHPEQWAPPLRLPRLPPHRWPAKSRLAYPPAPPCLSHPGAGPAETEWPGLPYPWCRRSVSPRLLRRRIAPERFRRRLFGRAHRLAVPRLVHRFALSRLRCRQDERRRRGAVCRAHRFGLVRLGCRRVAWQRLRRRRGWSGCQVCRRVRRSRRAAGQRAYLAAPLRFPDRAGRWPVSGRVFQWPGRSPADASARPFRRLVLGRSQGFPPGWPTGRSMPSSRRAWFGGRSPRSRRYRYRSGWACCSVAFPWRSLHRAR